MMISSADHRDLSVMCQAQVYVIVGQQKGRPSQPLGGAGAPVPVPSPLPTGLTWHENSGFDSSSRLP